VSPPPAVAIPNPLPNMKHPLLALASCALAAALSLSMRTEAATVVFADDFSTTSITSRGNPYVGGWFHDAQISFQQWTGATEASISGGGLNVHTTNQTRSAGIVLSPELFDGAGEYILKFDLSSYSGSSNNSAVATVWAGSGYDLGGTTGNAITVDTYTASLLAVGSAEVFQLAAMTLTAASTDNQISFSYDGTSAVAVFLGTTTAGWPFPAATYDNVSVSKIVSMPIPEPSAGVLIGAGMISLLRMRRRVF
jgi:hypothetical protein